jgi:TonB family protein
MLTVAGTGIAAWAAQPAAQAQAVHDFHYRIGATLEVDGERQDVALRDWPGRKVGFASTTKAGRAWRIELTVDPAEQPGQVKLSGDISVDGKPVSKPILIGALDQAMRIEVTPPDGSSTFALSMVVSQHDGAPGPDAASVPEQPAPAYPEDAKARGQSGLVVLKLRVGPDGRVREAIVESSEPAGLFDEASLAAARQWTFEPPTDNGVRGEGWVRVPIRYDVKGDPDGSGEGSPDTDPRTAWSTLDMTQSTSLRTLDCDEMKVDGDDPRKVSCGQRIANAR